jgi:hypothetical protein
MLQAEWEQARDDLGLDLVIPFDLSLGNDVTIHADLLVKNFGCPNGMIVVREYAAIKQYLTKIDELDYGSPCWMDRSIRMIEQLWSKCSVSGGGPGQWLRLRRGSSIQNTDITLFAVIHQKA